MSNRLAPPKPSHTSGRMTKISQMAQLAETHELGVSNIDHGPLTPNSCVHQR